MRSRIKSRLAAIRWRFNLWANNNRFYRRNMTAGFRRLPRPVQRGIGVFLFLLSPALLPLLCLWAYRDELLEGFSEVTMFAFGRWGE